MADIQKFLDQSGVSTLWSRIAEELNKKATKDAVEDVITMASTAQATADEAKAAVATNATAIQTNATAIQANADAIKVLNSDSSVEGSVAYQIAIIVAGADADFDTLKEIADWIATHPDSVSALQSQITDNKDAITELASLVGDTAVATQIANAIADANLDQYATADALATANDNLAAAVLRIATNETDIATLKGTVAGHTTDIGNNATAITNLASRVDGIVAGGGEPNTINSIKVNGVAQTITDKSVDIAVPVVQALTTEEIDTAIANASVQA